MIERKQFEIWLVDLNPTKGSEQQGIRPCVVLETNAVGSFGNTTIIAPLTSQLKKVFSYEVVVPANNQTGLSQDSKIKMRQMRTIDISRLIKKIGFTPASLHDKMRVNIAIVFDLEGVFA